jgi:hypothetical protein
LEKRTNLEQLLSQWEEAVIVRVVVVIVVEEVVDLQEFWVEVAQKSREVMGEVRYVSEVVDL